MEHSGYEPFRVPGAGHDGLCGYLHGHDGCDGALRVPGGRIVEKAPDHTGISVRNTWEALSLPYMIIAVVQALIVLLVAVILGFEPQGGVVGLLLAACVPGTAGGYRSGFGAANRNRGEKFRRGQWTIDDFCRADDGIRHFPGCIQRNDPHDCQVHPQLLQSPIL